VALPRVFVITLLALGLAVVVPRAPWSAAPRAEAPGPAITREGQLGGADHIIQVPENWRGGLVVYAHGIQRGLGRGDLRMLPMRAMSLTMGTRGSRRAIARASISPTCSSRTSPRSASCF